MCIRTDESKTTKQEFFIMKQKNLNTFSWWTGDENFFSRVHQLKEAIMAKGIIAALVVILVAVLSGCSEPAGNRGKQPVFPKGVNHVSVVPPYAEIERFSIVREGEIPKSAKAEYEIEAKLGLRPVILKRPIEALNHYRQDNSWRYEAIREGSIVFVDTSGIIRYKADCWNRLVVEPTLSERFLKLLRELF